MASGLTETEVIPQETSFWVAYIHDLGNPRGSLAVFPHHDDFGERLRLIIKRQMLEHVEKAEMGAK